GAESLLALRPLQGIGNVSYGWYLWHWPMVVLIPMAVGYQLAWPYLVNFSVLALWFAVLTHYLVERPTRHSRLSLPAWLGGGALTSGAVAALAADVLVPLPAFVGTGAAAQAIKLRSADSHAVQKALLEGLSTHTGPRNLLPQPVHAAADQPHTPA